MIYDFPVATAAIRQGDIFETIPRIDLSFGDLSIVNESNESEAVTWDAVRQSSKALTAVVGLRAVWAIVITQDCDTIRAPDDTLCEIKPFTSVVRGNVPSTEKKWTDYLRTQSVHNLKWFYLPADPAVGFADRMAVDFLATLRVTRPDLEASRHLRRGRLKGYADEHFRERLAEFFRRYPYNEWYPFTKGEFEAYRAAAEPKEAERILPYDHQR
jgi:hypothetical protein